MNEYIYFCNSCGNIVEKSKGIDEGPFCCGEMMYKVTPRTVGASVEKHAPLYKIEGRTVIVSVGEIAHPMEMNHYIEWIVLKTKIGHQKISLQPGDNTTVKFTIGEDDKVVSVFSYCNVHGLWKASDSQS